MDGRPVSVSDNAVLIPVLAQFWESDSIVVGSSVVVVWLPARVVVSVPDGFVAWTNATIAKARLLGILLDALVKCWVFSLRSSALQYGP